MNATALLSDMVAACPGGARLWIASPTAPWAALSHALPVTSRRMGLST
jgi:hypothetical protein